MLLARLTPWFPFDPTIDSALEHRHLILAYAVVVVVQLAYVSHLLLDNIRERARSRALLRAANPPR